jgi:hypothetical protein
MDESMINGYCFSGLYEIIYANRPYAICIPGRRFPNDLIARNNHLWDAARNLRASDNRRLSIPSRRQSKHSPDLERRVAHRSHPGEAWLRNQLNIPPG